jgi:hypothetical protein
MRGLNSALLLYCPADFFQGIFGGFGKFREFWIPAYAGMATFNEVIILAVKFFLGKGGVL